MAPKTTDNTFQAGGAAFPLFITVIKAWNPANHFSFPRFAWERLARQSHNQIAALTCVAVHSLISFLLCESLRTLRLCGCNLFFFNRRGAEYAEIRRERIF
uniref:Uncharacterized protein n=1 Tax=Candidatus Kentrum sp. DK TaxID=2126562 RepID=A0A450SVQ8_9GAMM|nr:MAG: hypothetical protein BECKDK2373B_GA0170837_107012 [Candidatus Kentron sp. DK]